MGLILGMPQQQEQPAHAIILILKLMNQLKLMTLTAHYLNLFKR